MTDSNHAPLTERERLACLLAVLRKGTQTPSFNLRQEAADVIEELAAGRDKMRQALLNLANAADEVGVRFFDTDTMEPEVERMQAATLRARALLDGGA